MRKFRAGGLAVGMGLIFLVSCRPAGDGSAHLVMVDADVPKAEAASSAVISVSSAAPASSAAAPAVSSAPSAASAPKPGALSGSQAASSTGSGLPSSPAPSAGGGPSQASPAPLSQEEAIEAVNAAFDRQNALPQVVFQYADSLDGGSAQQGKVTYNNCASAPVFDQIFRTSGAAQMEYSYAGGRLTCTSGGYTHEVTYDPGQLPAYVRLLTPRLSAGSLSNVTVSRQSDGGLIFQAADSGGGYGDAVGMAGLTAGSARVTGASVRYTVGPDGYLAASSQDITIHTDAGDRVFHSEKNYEPIHK